MTDKLNIKRVFNAPIDEAFDAWVDSKKLSAWHSPQGMVPTAKVNGKKGFQIKMKDDSHKMTHVVNGTYLEFIRPKRLVFTWQWEAPGGRAPKT